MKCYLRHIQSSLMYVLIVCSAYAVRIVPLNAENIRIADAFGNKCCSPIISIIGTGYVGLVTGAGLAEFGNHVICADIDSQKISLLQQGHVPIYEPGLEDLFKRNVANGRLLFTNNVIQAIQEADIIFIAVGTPMQDDGSADLFAVEAVIETIAQNINKHKTIVTKSTVPIGTGERLKNILLVNGVSIDEFDIVSNPEFLREGSAVGDFIHPDRLVLGIESSRALEKMQTIYAALLDDNVPCVSTDITSSETIKYASNAFLATKISFINEIANLCDKTGADTKTIAYAMGLDQRISPQFLKPGPGFGGSCFPKDTQALLYTAQQYGVDIHTVAAALKANELQKQVPVLKLLNIYASMGITNQPLKNKNIAVLGAAFKANTDDIRYSPAITTIQMLQEQGAQVRCYDPAAMPNMAQIFPDIIYCDNVYEALQDANAVIIMTEWDEFKKLDLEKVAQMVKNKIIVDARNILNISELKRLGFACEVIGQSCLCGA